MRELSKCAPFKEYEYIENIKRHVSWKVHFENNNPLIMH